MSSLLLGTVLFIIIIIIIIIMVPGTKIYFCKGSHAVPARPAGKGTLVAR
jgi:hypothetical protein